MAKLLSFLAAITTIARVGAALAPAALYHGGFGNDTDPEIRLKIGTGGAGQSGLVKALADAFIQSSVANGTDPFLVAWYTTDTTYSIKALQSGDVDLAITYNPAAELVAVAQGIALSRHYLFRDHFLLVGPPSNPAQLRYPPPPADSVLSLFKTLHEAAEAGNTTTRFLSRYDKSATNIKESQLWLAIGQVPWATAYSTWYHQYIAFPIQALTAAVVLEEYTLTDRGTYLSVGEEVRGKTTVYRASGDEEEDLLLNPGHVLVGKNAPELELARAFVAWAVGREGQEVVRGFKKGGEVLYSPAP